LRNSDRGETLSFDELAAVEERSAPTTDSKESDDQPSIPHKSAIGGNLTSQLSVEIAGGDPLHYGTPVAVQTRALNLCLALNSNDAEPAVPERCNPIQVLNPGGIRLCVRNPNGQVAGTVSANVCHRGYRAHDLGEVVHSKQSLVT
jgi:hypothetical protein